MIKLKKVLLEDYNYGEDDKYNDFNPDHKYLIDGVNRHSIDDFDSYTKTTDDPAEAIKFWVESQSVVPLSASIDCRDRIIAEEFYNWLTDEKNFNFIESMLKKQNQYNVHEMMKLIKKYKEWGFDTWLKSCDNTAYGYAEFTISQLPPFDVG